MKIKKSRIAVWVVILFCASLFLSGNLALANSPIELKLGSSTCLPGDTIKVPLMISSQGDVAGIQVDIKYNSQFLIYKGIESGELSPGFLVSASETDGKLRVIVVNINSTCIASGSGTIADIALQVADTAQSGQTYDVGLESDSLILSDAGSNKITEQVDLVGGSITVARQSVDKISVTGVSLDKQEITLQEGKTGITLVATVTPTNATDMSLLWNSSDSKVALVDKGLVSPVGSGKAVITASTLDGNKSASCTVEVIASSADNGNNNSSGSSSPTPTGSGLNSSPITQPSPITTQIVKPEPSADPSDIKGHWAQSQISKWVKKGLIKGYGDGTFHPDNQITRAEFITLVNGAFGFNTGTVNGFSDVKNSDWFVGGVAHASKAGYISGYLDGTFKPDLFISRQEVASIIQKIVKMNLTGNLELLDQLTDASELPAWSKEAVATVLAKGYLKGYPDGSFEPERAISRAESVVVLYRVVDGMSSSKGQ